MPRFAPARQDSLQPPVGDRRANDEFRHRSNARPGDNRGQGSLTLFARRRPELRTVTVSPASLVKCQVSRVHRYA